MPEQERIENNWAASREELAQVLRELAAAQKETDRQLKETERLLQEQSREADRRRKQADQETRELKKQLGGLGDKFGSFTEGLALPAMTKILYRDFNMSTVSPRVRARENGHSLEIDVLAWSKDPDGDVVVVEVKSHLREDGIEQMRKILRRFRDFFPEYAHRKVYGILAAVDVPEDVGEKVLREGLYLARIHEDQFELQVPEGFQARAF